MLSLRWKNNIKLWGGPWQGNTHVMSRFRLFILMAVSVEIPIHIDIVTIKASISRFTRRRQASLKERHSSSWPLKINCSSSKLSVPRSMSSSLASSTSSFKFILLITFERVLKCFEVFENFSFQKNLQRILYLNSIFVRQFLRHLKSCKDVGFYTLLQYLQLSHESCNVQ